MTACLKLGLLDNARLLPWQRVALDDLRHSGVVRQAFDVTRCRHDVAPRDVVPTTTDVMVTSHGDVLLSSMNDVTRTRDVSSAAMTRNFIGRLRDESAQTCDFIVVRFLLDGPLTTATKRHVYFSQSTRQHALIFPPAQSWRTTQLHYFLLTDMAACPLPLHA